MIKNIIFDLGGVLLMDKPISSLNKICNNQNDYEILKIFFNDWKSLDLGTESLEDKYYKCNFSKEIDNKYKYKLLHYYEYRDMNMKLIKLINILKKNNYNVYILSDNNKESYDYYTKHELLKNIDGFILSCNYNTLKKEGTLFDILLKEYNLKPDECYFIDDKKENIEISKKHNIKGYLFSQDDNIGLLYNDLKDNKVNL